MRFVQICVLLFFSFVLGSYLHEAVAQTSVHVTLPDTLRMRCDSSEGAIYPYVVRPGETLYSISKAFETDIFRLNELNPWLDDRILKIGDTLNIPLRNKIHWDGNISKRSLPVFYTVHAKDNVFRICRICAGIHEQKILKANDKDSPGLVPGEQLLIGYFHPGIRDTTAQMELVNDLDRREQKVFEGKYSRKESSWHMQSERGVAVWNRSKSSHSNYYILHKSAPVNSVIEVVNPMNDRKVYAKVVGHLPSNTYPEEVIAVVSPAVANYLGVLDPRFYVRLRYRIPLAEVSKR